MSTEGPSFASPPDGRSLRIAIVAANTFEHDSRLLRTGRALAAEGHRVTVVAFAESGLPGSQELEERLDVRRVAVDRRVVAAFRPLPEPLRAALAALLGIPPGATALPAAVPRGADRWRAPVRRLVEILAHGRRVGPWRDAVVGAVPDADVYHCKALVALPVVAAAARRSGATPRAGAAARVGAFGPTRAAGRARPGAVFAYDLADLHSEAARLARMPAAVRRLVRAREGRWVRGASVLTAVSPGIAAEASRRFRVPSPVLMLNCPPAWKPLELRPPPSSRIRDATGLAEDRPIILYQGGFSMDRGIEELVAALDEPPLREANAAVVLLGYGRLRHALTAAAARRPGRVFVLDAVPPAELLDWTASADLGYVGQPPRTLNQRLNLANKLFECIMAGVPVLVAEGTEHCRLVTEERLGTCAAIAPAQLAAAAADLLGRPAAEREDLRAHVRRVALGRYTWERQQGGLLDAYRALARLVDAGSVPTWASVRAAGAGQSELAGTGGGTRS